MKRFAGAFAFLAVLGGAGLLTGAALAPAPVSAACENDECEGGNRCKVNTTTACDVLATGGCKTVGCDKAEL
ncbi:MAG: hypothetical protein KY464_13115 [Gemmatimonadetes bacterium]|nr:hypothetical protein [Gemmatimonadota bacterium]